MTRYGFRKLYKFTELEISSSELWSRAGDSTALRLRQSDGLRKWDSRAGYEANDTVG